MIGVFGISEAQFWSTVCRSESHAVSLGRSWSTGKLTFVDMWKALYEVHRCWTVGWHSKIVPYGSQIVQDFTSHCVWMYMEREALRALCKSPDRSCSNTWRHHDVHYGRPISLHSMLFWGTDIVNHGCHLYIKSKSNHNDPRQDTNAPNTYTQQTRGIYRLPMYKTWLCKYVAASSSQPGQPHLRTSQRY